jgi:hypothetical protein
MHDATFINDTVDLLRLFILILVHHKVAASAGGFPVNAAIVVTTHVLFYMLEFIAVTDAPHFLYAELRSYTRRCLELKPFHLNDGRIHRYCPSLIRADSPLD